MLRLPPWLPVANFVVADTSMQPVLRPGDRLLVNRWSRIRAGDIIVLRDPDSPSQFLAKRVAERTPRGQLVVHADNPNVSRDSRTFGAVPAALVVGRVVWRYLPSDRRGPVEPGGNR